MARHGAGGARGAHPVADEEDDERELEPVQHAHAHVLPAPRGSARWAPAQGRRGTVAANASLRHASSERSVTAPTNGRISNKQCCSEAFGATAFILAAARTMPILRRDIVGPRVSTRTAPPRGTRTVARPLRPRCRQQIGWARREAAGGTAGTVCCRSVRVGTDRPPPRSAARRRPRSLPVSGRSVPDLTRVTGLGGGLGATPGRSPWP